MPAALLATEYPAVFCAALAERLDVVGPFDRPVEAALTPEQRAAVTVLVTMGTLKADASLMDALPHLGLICNYGSGFEGTDLAAADARGIAVTNSLGANASAVADLAMGLMIAACRRIVAADRLIRDGRWTRTAAERMPLVRGLTGRRVGIFGLGAIGERIARRAEAFEMTVAYHNRTERTDVAWPWHNTLQSLADWSDVLVVAARADAGNGHIVGRNVMRALGPDGIVVNIGRGSLLDETALAELIAAGELGGAGLDVFEREPFVPDALKALDHVVLTPHIAGGAFDAHAAMKDMVLANVDAFLAGKPLPTPIDLKPMGTPDTEA